MNEPDEGIQGERDKSEQKSMAVPLKTRMVRRLSFNKFKSGMVPLNVLPPRSRLMRLCVEELVQKKLSRRPRVGVVGLEMVTLSK